jgi:hypothetical protein
MRNQKLYQRFGLVALSIIFTGMSQIVLAHGTGSSGGGAPAEKRFIESARKLYSELTADPHLVQETFKSEETERLLKTEGLLRGFLRAIDTTAVQCAVSKQLNKIKKLEKVAYYESSKKTIYIDCFRENEIDKGIRFHEYMRSLGIEASQYEHSSKLELVLDTINNNRVVMECADDNSKLKVIIYVNKTVFAVITENAGTDRISVRAPEFSTYESVSIRSAPLYEHIFSEKRVIEAQNFKMTQLSEHHARSDGTSTGGYALEAISNSGKHISSPEVNCSWPGGQRTWPLN